MRTLYRLNWMFVLTLVCALTHVETAFSFDEFAKILKVGKKAVLIKRGVEKIKRGDKLTVYDEIDEAVGKVRITKVGKKKAIGKIISGKAQKGWTLEAELGMSTGYGEGDSYGDGYAYSSSSESMRPYSDYDEAESILERKYEKPRDRQPTSDYMAQNRNDYSGNDDYSRNEARNDSRSEYMRPITKSSKHNYVGLMGGTSNHSMSLNDGETSSEMKGSFTSYHVVGSYQWSRNIDVLYSIGQEKFSVVGPVLNGLCEGEDCGMTIDYIIGTALGRYRFSEGKFVPWLAGGIGVASPSTVASNTVDPESIATSLAGVGAAGLDYMVMENWRLLMQARYVRISSGQTMMSGLAGLAYDF